MRMLGATLIGLMLILSAVAVAQEAKPVTASVAVELKDAAGDMGPITTSEGEEPPLDVVLLAVRSDGQRLAFAATIKDSLGTFATSPVSIYIDADNNPATGAKLFVGEQGGFEYRAQLSMCIKYDNGAEACSGGSNGKPTERYGAVDLERFLGDSDFGEKETVVDSMGFGKSKKAVQVPVAGLVVEAPIDYADIKAKPGQTLRLLAREEGGSPRDGDGFFPTVLLTLK